MSPPADDLFNLKLENGHPIQKLDISLLQSDANKNNFELEKISSEKNNVKVKEAKRPVEILKNFAGIGLTLLASLLSSTNLILVKMLQKSSSMGAAELTVAGYFGVFFPSLPLIIYFECRSEGSGPKKWRPKVQNENGQEVSSSVFDSVWPFKISERRVNAIGLTVQAFFGAGSILFRFFALKYISVGDTAVISIGSPVIVTILAHFFLHERTGVVPILMAILALVGVAIIARPPILTGSETFDSEAMIGTAYAVASLICTALQTIIWRKIRGVQFAVQLLVSGAIGMAVPLVVALIMSDGKFSLPIGWQDTGLTGVVSLFGFGVTFCMMLALKMETAGVVSLVRTFDAIFGFLLQLILFNILPDVYSSVGAVIICFGVLVVGFRKYFESLSSSTSTDDDSHHNTGGRNTCVSFLLK